MVTKADEAAKDLYLSIMEEVMIRAFSINTTIKTPTKIPQPLIRECCYLQVRMLCELIALGCLVAHGDITNTNYFQNKAYKADDILQQLEKLHPNFYPIPFKPIFSEPTAEFPKGGIGLAPMEADYLKKDELIALYAKCGSVLHKGTLRRFLKIKMEPEPNPYREVVRRTQKLINLMTAHRISRKGNLLHFMALLNLTAPDSDQANVQVFLVESSLPK
jgi:hypothetical protein